jgi:hypothetical protein
MISNYLSPYTDQVTNATINDSDLALRKSLNDITAQFGGQTGNTQAGVAAGTAVSDSLTRLAPILAQTRQQGFTTALSGAQGDAANALSANTSNAANTLANNEFNVGAQQSNDQQSMQAIRDYVGNLTNNNAITTGNAQTQYGMGGGGVTNLLQYLSSQVPAFGQTNTGTSTGSTSQTGTTSGQSDTSQSGNSSGNSNSYGSGAKASIGGK